RPWASVRSLAMIGVDVLAKQSDLPNTLLYEPHRLVVHLGDRPRDLHSAGVGHHAERAELVAARLHCQKCRGRPLAFPPGQTRKFVLVRKVRVDELAVLEAGASGEIRQAMIGLRTDHQVDDWSAGDDLCALSLGYATGDSHRGILALQPPRELDLP